MKLNPLTPKWQHDDANVRLQSIASGKLTQEILEQLATYDESSEVRVAAAALLENNQLLLQLSVCPDPLVSNIAAARWVSRISADSDHLALINPELPIPLLLRIASDAELVEFRLAAAELIDQPTDIESLLANNNHTRVHQLLARKVSDPEQLQRVLHLFNDRDKNVLHIVKDALQEIKSQAAAEAALLEATNKLVEQLAILSNSDYSKEFVRRLSVIDDQWQQLGASNELDTALAQQAQTYLATCKEKVLSVARRAAEQDALVASLLADCDALEEQTSQLIAQTRLPAAISKAPEKEIESVLEEEVKTATEDEAVAAEISEVVLDAAIDAAVEEVVETTAETVVDAIPEVVVDVIPEVVADTTVSDQTEALDTLKASLSAIVKQWPGEYRIAELHEKSKPLNHLINALEEWLGLLTGEQEFSPKEYLARLQRLEWPEAHTAPVALTEKLAEKIASLEKNIAAQNKISAERQQINTAMQAQIDKLKAEIAAGKTKPANKLMSSLHKQLSDASESQSNEIKALAKQLQDLKDWQGFATNPKRQALCEQMEHLGNDAGIPALEKSKAIKELQEQWKSLGPSDSRQGQRLWSKFKKLGDIAYAPCAVYFAEQHAVREENLKQRVRICESLERLQTEEYWENPDWKAVSETLAAARTEWHQFSDVPNAKRNKIQRRFEKCTSYIQQRLNGEQTLNLQRKQAITEQVATLLAEEMPVKVLVEKTKQLQRDWKLIGITDRKADQKLWKAFRRVCDQVFEKRDEKVVEQKKQLDEIGNQAKALCDEFAAQLDFDVSITSADINKFRKAFRALPLDKQHTGIRQSSEKLIKKASKIVDDQVTANKQHMLQEFQRQCELYDEHAAGKLSDEALEAGLQSEIILEPTLVKRLEQKRQQTTAEATTQNQDQCETILIRLEILAGIDSPTASQTARMAYQVERLNRELSKGEKETRTYQQQVDALVLDWFALSGKTDEAIQRYQRVATKLGKL